MWREYKDHPVQIRFPFRKFNLNNFLTLGLLIGTILTTWNVRTLLNYEGNGQHFYESQKISGKKYAIHGRRVDSGYLKHVYNVLEKFNYKRVNVTDDWDVLWAHDYPFKTIDLTYHKSDKMVNKFPGSGYITNKMNLATTKLPFVPQAFQIPKEIKELKAYADAHPSYRFVQKSNNHRGIKIEKLEKLDLTNEKSFVQVYVSNPLLVDKFKFDIGIYTILTSVNPLRVYINKEVLFRFCKVEYHPFDPDVLEKYVVGDDYKPIWEVPSLKPFTDNGFGFKESFDGFLKSRGKDPEKVWSKVENAIRSTYLEKETLLIESKKPYKAKFFEMVRFDFVIDDDLNVFLMEANMSPNLSSAHFPPNKLLYEQVLHSLFKLVGLDRTKEEMEVSLKHIATNPSLCAKCTNCAECKLCLKCLSADEKDDLKEAYLEHVNKHDCKRIFPTTEKEDISGLTAENIRLIDWYRAKCSLDASFC